MRWLLLLAPLLVAGCAVPPPEAYGGVSAGRPDRAVDLGQNDVGEPCVQAANASGTSDIYCGTWQQPSGRVRAAGAGDASRLTTLITSGSWRLALDNTYSCEAPRATNLGDAPALVMNCSRRVGGWPHVALAAEAGGRAWLADGVVSALPAITRSIAILSGRAPATVVSNAAVNALQAERRGAQARATGDVREYDSLMLQGARANLADNPMAAESAYGAALALEEKALGADNPNVADPAMHLALQLSNEGRFAEADTLFARAASLAPRQQGDDTLMARLLHYEGLHAYNQHKNDLALALLQRADAAYLATVPPDALRASPSSSRTGETSLDQVLATPLQRQVRVALSGLVEVRRYQGVVLRDMNRLPESEAAIMSAEEVARSGAIERPELIARLRRTAAVSAAASGDRAAAITDFRDSNSAFAQAYPGSRPLALVGLLRAGELMQAGQSGPAVAICRDSMKVLIDIKSAFEPERMTGCLNAFAKEAAASGTDAARQPLLRDMFEAAQLVRGSTTSQQIQQASARLAAGGANARVGDAIREQQDAAASLADIRRRRQELAQIKQPPASAQAEAKRLEDQEHAATEALANRENALQAAAPNYDQLVQQATSAEDVLRTLKPGEGFASVVLTGNEGWTFLLHDGAVQVGRIPGGAGAVNPLVTRIRRSVEPDLPAFDTASAQRLYTLVFGDLGGALGGVQALTVAPTGSLLSLPFSVMLTGPADPGALANAPWLVRRMAIGHVPSAGNFVALRRVSGGSRATQPWFGFGDFRPVTLAQAQRSFPASCGDSAALLAHLPPLPSARTELEVARKLVGGGAGDTLLGPQFTAAAVEQQSLSNYRVLHFATHAILPSDLACQSEPALVTSAPAGARDAAGALLKASDLAQIKLDADLVILSACNSGGADGTSGGESLSTLARSFFYGGARSLLITHWEVSDQAATFMVADTLRRMEAEPGLGVAGALRAAQVGVFERAGSALPAEFAHPFFWAPFALEGQAGAPVQGSVARVNATAPDTMEGAPDRAPPATRPRAKYPKGVR